MAVSLQSKVSNLLMSALPTDLQVLSEDVEEIDSPLMTKRSLSKVSRAESHRSRNQKKGPDCSI
jgi:hypothetical protein